MPQEIFLRQDAICCRNAWLESAAVLGNPKRFASRVRNMVIGSSYEAMRAHTYTYARLLCCQGEHTKWPSNEQLLRKIAPSSSSHPHNMNPQLIC